MSTAYESTYERAPGATDVATLQIAFVIGLGFLLRIVGLGWESLWYDEACSLDMISASVSEIVNGSKLTPGNPFGYFALLRIWCEQFGFSIESARAMSAVIGTLVIPATWLAAYHMTQDRRVSLAAAFLVAINPPAVFLSREARVYPLLTLFTVLATMYASKIIRTSKFYDWVGFTITCAILPHLHYYSFFFLMVIGLLILWFRRTTFWGTLGCLVLAYLVMFLAFLPGLRLFLTQLDIVQKVAVNSLPQILSFPVYIFGGRSFVWKQDGVLLLVCAEALVLCGIWIPALWQLRKDRQAPWLALLVGSGVYLVAIIVSGFYMSMFNARYVSFIAPLLLIAIAYALLAMLRAGGRGSSIPAILLAVVTCISLVRMYTEPQKDDWRSLSQYVAMQNPQLPIVFYEDIGALTYKYYRADQHSIQLFEAFDDDGTNWEKAGYGEMLGKLPEYWLVVSPIWSEEVPQNVTRWCAQHGELIDQKTFKGLYLARFRNDKEGLESISDDRGHQSSTTEIQPAG